MIIQALPGCGKTAVCRARPTVFTYGDSLFEEVTKLKASKENFDLVQTSRPGLLTTLASRYLRFADNMELHLLTNVAPHTIGAVCGYLRVAYRQDDYLQHLKIAGRRDIVNGFSEDVLKSWAAAYQDKRQITEFLTAYEFLSDSLLLHAVTAISSRSHDEPLAGDYKFDSSSGRFVSRSG